jgi:hypothetical protein
MLLLDASITRTIIDALGTRVVHRDVTTPISVNNFFHEYIPSLRYLHLIIDMTR